MPELVKCDWCDKMVPIQPEIFVQGGYEEVPDPEVMEGEEWKGTVRAPRIEPSNLPAEQREQMKLEMGLDDKELDQLLLTGSVGNVGVVVCLECQDAAEKEQDQPPS
jgi:hypothetical protein